jgi:hypothetical protein
MGNSLREVAGGAIRLMALGYPKGWLTATDLLEGRGSEKLTYRYIGPDSRLNDVHGRVVAVVVSI